MSKLLNIFLLLYAIMIAGCTVGEDYSRKKYSPDVPNEFINNPENFSNAESRYEKWSGKWWQQFKDPETNRLVQAALENNLSIKSAFSRVKQAKENLNIQASQDWPYAKLELSASRGKEMPAYKPSDNLQAGLRINYLLDLFGKQASGEQAALQRYLASVESRLAVMHSVVSSTVKLRALSVVAKMQLTVSRQNADSWQKTVRTVERRYRNGVSNISEVYLARQNLASVNSETSDYEKQLKDYLYSLDIILGRAPGSTELKGDSIGLPEPAKISDMIPASLLDRRPDLRAGRRRLSASVQDLNVSIADMYPQISLTASGGRLSDDFSGLLESSNSVYSLAANITQPLFEGGRLKAAVKYNRARVEELAFEYSKSFLDALKEVETLLLQERLYNTQLKHLKESLKQAEKAERSIKREYNSGLAPFTALLQTERRRRNTEFQVNYMIGQIWVNRCNLHLALGGNWEMKNNDK
ncbi:Toluene efflux pump outer membrane protein TtgI precursor [Sedimentisphaera cyanobacteriorum]|uniref:Toluene efflux pump outer membrane protein TtgI n=1 Tax=Sedimentisphaera cyanobacteriorum TaxID=1940790 RepID=A0A1Q2HMN6_9BACT|nr:efflux transporter outer membrane subunit [Sedimentisphaera cyanobacteriorum]AQQ08799.1 Toluene efflux pump outer membrane protein TtgI precursor [Sedimentisphaera cyanobacteriorum]